MCARFFSSRTRNSLPTRQRQFSRMEKCCDAFQTNLLPVKSRPTFELIWLVNKWTTKRSSLPTGSRVNVPVLCCCCQSLQDFVTNGWKSLKKPWWVRKKVNFRRLCQKKIIYELLRNYKALVNDCFLLFSVCNGNNRYTLHMSYVKRHRGKRFESTLFSWWRNCVIPQTPAHSSLPADDESSVLMK